MRLPILALLLGLSTSETTAAPRSGVASASAPTSTVVECDATKVTKAARKKVRAAKPGKKVFTSVPPVMSAFEGNRYKPGKAFAEISPMDIWDGALSAVLFDVDEIGWGNAQFGEPGSTPGRLVVTLESDPGMFVLSCLVARTSGEPTTFQVETPTGEKHKVVPALMVDWIHITLDAAQTGKFSFELQADHSWAWGDCRVAPLLGNAATPTIP